MPTYTTSDITQLTAETTPGRNPFKEMEEAKDLDTLKRLWTENKSLQKDNLFLGLKEKRKAELSAQAITVQDILGKTEEVIPFDIPAKKHGAGSI